MEGFEFGLLMLGVLLILIALRLPIAIAMIFVGMIGYTSISGWNTLLNYLNTSAYWRFSTYDFSVVPLFLLMGQFATRAGMSKALFEAANVFVGHRRGGVAIAAIAVAIRVLVSSAAPPWANTRNATNHDRIANSSQLCPA